ncbi:hypothetical protein MNBD_GAMMA26-2606 [hydrothermal vent metagenome]|uniref:Doubled CXXCH motif domain-containing protein n=1 Tax=hydrothermal vent metagenome TaxID=652676 RepID=A0A3B1B292_9ZZZZ
MSSWPKFSWVMPNGWLPIFISLAMTLVMCSVANAKDNHLKALACQDCHLAGDSATPQNAHQLVATQEQLCGRCHDKILLVSHPSGFRPNRTIPAEYPLDSRGYITCSTCHLAHGNGRLLMRNDTHGRELCLSCHDMAFFERMVDGGLLVQNRGHMGHQEMVSEELMLDSYTANCTSCHSRTVRIGRIGPSQISHLLAHGPTTMPHPIGFIYVGDQSLRHRPRSELDKRLILPDGRLSCVTCHRVYDDGHGSLVMSNEGSALCFQCHDI